MSFINYCFMFQYSKLENIYYLFVIMYKTFYSYPFFIFGAIFLFLTNYN